MPNIHVWRWPVLLLLLAAWAAPDQARAEAASTTSCLRGRPRPECTSYWVTESLFGIRHRQDLGLARWYYGSSGESSFAYGAAVGWMKNMADRRALGAVIQVSDIGVRVGPRLRFWLTPDFALDVDLGPRWEPGRIETVEAEIALGWRDLVGISIAAARDFGGNRQEFRFGVRPGSWVGLSTYAAALAGAVLVIVAYKPD